MLDVREIRHAHFFCGLGGGARGFNRGSARVGNMVAKFRCIGGIDVDPASIRDFERLAGVPGTLMDLFSREQYTAFHGHEPPAGWAEALPVDIRRALGPKRPHIVFLSAPCKGFSGLLSETQSLTDKYQALNALTLRGLWLMLEAYGNDPPELIIFENVPRIATRGRSLLDQIVKMLRHYGYVVAETTHDCGELGGLGQSRKRFLLVARHAAKVPPFLYEPPKKRLRGVGEILERLPLPGDTDIGGPMNRMPALQWKTWVRLALVKAGSDWRSLKDYRIEDGVLADFGIMPEEAFRSAAFGVLDWKEHSGAVIGESFPTNGRFAVADPRVENSREGSGFLGVNGWADPSGTVTANGRPGAGAFSVADPRADLWGSGQAGVTPWDEPSGTITTQRSPLQGAFSVADPRYHNAHPKAVHHGVRRWDQTAAVVKGDVSVGTGPYAVADPRVDHDGPRFSNAYRIVAWDEASRAVTSAHGALAAVADPRPAEHANYQQVKYRVTEMREPAGAVIAASTTGNGAFAVADPRGPWTEATHTNKFSVTPFDQPAQAVIGTNRGPGSGAACVADPRPDFARDGRDVYLTQGHYGVLPWDSSSRSVTASGQHDNGAWSVADPRPAIGHGPVGLPQPNDQLVAVIRSTDGTWHRPFVTLELAALQSLFDPEEVFSSDAQRERLKWILDGQSDSGWRERIGNAVPSDAATAVASEMGRTLLLAWSGESFSLSTDPIWVQPQLGLQIALSVDIPDLEAIL